MEHITRFKDLVSEATIEKLKSRCRERDLHYPKGIEDAVCQIIFGEEATIQLDDGTYLLMPVGNERQALLYQIEKIHTYPYTYGIRPSSLGSAFLPNGDHSRFTPITIEDADIEPIRKSYIEHYRNQLGEEWSEKDFQDRLNSLSYRTYKYAKDVKTGKVYVVGFFGAQIATGAGGRYLTNAELYVLPQFRGQGIATELVNQSFGLASEDGIKGFDSLTYRVPGHNALGFWEGIGASVTDLYHIAGDIDEMRDIIAEKTAAQEAVPQRKK